MPPDSGSVQLDFVGRKIPCLTQACLRTLTTPISVGETWNDNISWMYAPQTAVVKAKQAASPEPQVKEDTVKNLKVTDQTFAGLSQLADRLGFVHGARGEHPFSPNVSALLHGLATGEVFLPGTPLHRTMSATSAAQVNGLNAFNNGRKAPQCSSGCVATAQDSLAGPQKVQQRSRQHCTLFCRSPCRVTVCNISRNLLHCP